MSFIKTFFVLVLSIYIVRSDSEGPQAKGQNVILLLIDGYGAELFNRTNAAVRVGAETLLTNGVRAEYLKPVFPTQSYPNWFSLSTGLYVESHNFTSDFMFDEDLGIYFERDEGPNDTNHVWWDGLPDPLWYTAGKAGIDIHCYWFATCHRAHGDMVVQVAKDRRHSFKNKDVLDPFPHLPRVMKHIKKYQPYRQQLVLLRYNGVANALRHFGEETNAINEALSNADTLIRKIQEEMDSNSLMESTNLIVLSDHGLMEIYEDEKLYIEDCLSDLTKIKRVVNSMSLMMVYPEEDQEDVVFFELKVCDQWAPMGDYDDDDSPLVSIYRKYEIPEKYHWRDARNIAPIVIIPRPGAVLMTRHIQTNEINEANAKDFKMISGWDNNHPELNGIFLARGPAFKVEHTIPSMEIVDVYQLVMNILGVEANKHNGTWETVEELLSDGWESRTESRAGSISRQFTCPNSGVPKVGDNGEEVQCLPGQSAEITCGRGYSCYFSGFNYRCCPTAEEDYDDKLHGADCPLGSLNVLDSEGSPIRCNPRTGKCPNGNEFCWKQNSNAICCENLTKTKPSAATRTTQKEVSGAATESTIKDIVFPEIPSILDLECPGNSLTVLRDTGEPFTCRADSDCPNSNMKCQKASSRNSICCESLETAKNELDDEPLIKELEPINEPKGPNPLRYTPEDAARIQDEIQIQKEIESAIVGKPKKTDKIEKLTKTETIEKPKEKKSRAFADNENTRRISFTTRRPKIHENPEPKNPKAFGIQTDTRNNVDKKVIVEYQPHNQGGYAISRKLEKINSRVLNPERKALAQEFIASQIRQGWPYNEKFYRPDNVAVVKNRGRTEAVLHFPN
ncbi:hypothetical protein FO519_000220 [Halicephalobus sp. NKZ332]|nr:hypothetical protein FO519_000220 [Halicephalobus sp. NKZ332]